MSNVLNVSAILIAECKLYRRFQSPNVLIINALRVVVAYGFIRTRRVPIHRDEISKCAY